jgi:N4-gp56 family major capsid protein
MALTASAVSNSNLSNTQAVYYESQAIESLFMHLAFQTLTTPRSLPPNKGKTIQLFSYSTSWATSGVTAGNQPATQTEGTVGTGLVPTAPDVQAVLGEYADYITVSSFSKEIAIDPMLENLSKVLGYRGALVSDTITQMEFDTATALDSTSTLDLAAGTYVTASTIRQQVATLQGKNILPFEDGMYRGLVHPYVASDIFNDTTINGVTDVLKRSESGQQLLRDGWGKGNNYNVVEFAGVKFITSPNVPIVTVASSSGPLSGTLAYSSYIAGADAVFAIKLGEADDVPEGNFKSRILEFEPSVVDPALQIGGAVSYRFLFVAAPRPGTTNGFVRIRSNSAI